MSPEKNQKRREAEGQLARLLIARSVFNETICPSAVIEQAGFSVPAFMTAEDLISEHLTDEITRLVRELYRGSSDAS